MLAIAACVACGGGTQDAGDLRREVVVSAASSLGPALVEAAQAFEETTPGTAVRLNLAGSSALREQILGGAPVDVFAPAGPTHMDRVVDSGAVASEPRTLVRNRLRIGVPAGNPAGVAGLADFGREELWLGLCARGVPCGDLAREVLDAAGVAASIDTDEPNARALLARIEAGELDAGLVYATDVASNDAVAGIDIPEALNVTAEYPIAPLARAPNPEGAAAFVAFACSDAGREILRRHGFALP